MLRFIIGTLSLVALCNATEEDNTQSELYGMWTCHSTGNTYVVDYKESCSTNTCGLCLNEGESLATPWCYMSELTPHTVACSDDGTVTVNVFDGSSCDDMGIISETHNHISGECQSTDHADMADHNDDACQDAYIDLTAATATDGVCAHANSLGFCTAACQDFLDSICDSCEEGDNWGEDKFQGLTVWASFETSIGTAANCVPAECYFTSAAGRRPVLGLVTLLLAFFYVAN